ncbi:bifunctional glycosyltransferase/CDP-glycerol:glycerophosphate glycerophosphotransferase [Wenjunlia tyrosinilytica]|uniref:Glycosyl transferase n=1 Tax=Wenjunlia tyrosinilytica TaxID=1544741 RepID=A0A917ZYI2_9ACTN|nr:bifunctional glycosyltransferase family 2 protein/CDP-glycerol:glycerophosphate glycerophosphotransferase [Wenjunlia tyrosinilytica]GGO97406.1 glycosyl transferase [Wenjunlia tyrosinilytica]
MPRFSVIVPVHRVRGYLRECLDSVLGQSFTDFELIAVDDRCPDGGGAVIDEYAARDQRVVPVHLPRNVGLGPARNEGMARARGDYLLFLDSDDRWTPGTLDAIAARLAGTGDPQILVLDYARTYWWGQVQRNVLSRILAADGVFTVRERPELLDLIMVAWNKAYRRDFVEREALAFPAGAYEDTAWTFPALLSARRIACLDRVCVLYRQRRTGSILTTPGRAHFDVLDQYDRVFAFTAHSPATAEWRHDLHRTLYRKMAEHCLEVLARPDRIPRTARAEFFRKAGLRYRRYRPVGYRGPRGMAGLKYVLVLRGAHRTFEALRAANRLRVAARERLGPLRAAASRARTALYYRAQLRRPVDENLAVYSSYWGRGYGCNPAAVHAKALELAPHIRGVFLVTEDAREHVPPGVEAVVIGSRRYWEVMARAKYTFNNVNFEMAVRKREGTVHVQTQHGTPLKLMGVDQHVFPAAARGENFTKLLERADRWDYCLSSNRHSTRVWDRAYPCGYRTLEYGYPRNDAFYTATPEEVLRIRERLGLPPGTVALLYAPTHRDYSRDFEPQLDLERFCAALGPRFTVLLRAHHFYDESPRVRALVESGKLVDVTGHRSPEEVCLAADALICDYSSIVFDYANLDRPMVVYANDWQVYRETRGVYFDLMACPPGPVAGTQEELVEVFRSGAWSDERSAAARAAFRERFCEFDDGRAAERVVRAVLLGEAEVPPVAPPHERTPAVSPERARLLVRGTAAIPQPGHAAVTAAPS